LVHVKALILKLIMVSLVFLIVLSGFNGYPAVDVVLLSLAVTAVSYVVGDLLILRNSNNLVATISDLALVMVLIWLMSIPLLGGGVPFGLVFLTAVIIAAGEWVLHLYMTNVVHPNMESPSLS
jgi:hypothetical protein